MALEFIHRVPSNPKRLALFPGTWNPPTIAHLDIAHAAVREAVCEVDELIWVLPRTFPHKEFESAPFEARRGMIGTIARLDPRFSAAVSEGGLYVDIAREAREQFGSNTEIVLVLGRDAAERIAAWDYGAPGVFDDLVRRHRLLVAARHGNYQPAARHRDRISCLPMAASWDEVSSSEVRRRIAAGENWYDLVHPDLAEIIEDLYLNSHAGSREKNRRR